MPCNMIARADARVSNQVLAKLLTPPVVEKVLIPWLTEKLQAEVRAETRGDTLFLYVSAYVVRVQNGQVTVTGGYSYTEMRDFAAAITAHLTKIAGLLCQQQIKNALAKKFALESVQTAPTGSLVINVEI